MIIRLIFFASGIIEPNAGNLTGMLEGILLMWALGGVGVAVVTGLFGMLIGYGVYRSKRS